MECIFTGAAMLIVLGAIFIVMLGSVVQGSLGIGLGFIAVPLLALLNQDFVPGPLLLAALLLTILVSYREYDSIVFKEINWAVLGRIMGTALGATTLTLVPENKLAVLFGIMVLSAVGMSFLGFRLKLSPGNLILTGILSGIMGTTSAIGGVPIALIYQDLRGPKFRGTLSAIFVMGTLISIISLILIGKFGRQELILSLELMPGILIGYFVSNLTARIFDRGYIRLAILGFAGLSGIIILIRGLL
jgi:uncharacterized membrane protein YfcA